MNLPLPLVILAIIGHAHADPTLASINWRPACDGSFIEIVRDHSKIQSITASETHSKIINEWCIHFINGSPISAEYRQFARHQISEGENAGAYTGNNPLKQIQTWKYEHNHFDVQDEQLGKDLNEILALASK